MGTAVEPMIWAVARQTNMNIWTRTQAVGAETLVEMPTHLIVICAMMQTAMAMSSFVTAPFRVADSTLCDKVH